MTRTPRWRSLRDGVWMLVLLALLSMLVTLHLGHRLPWMKEADFSLHGQNVETDQGHLGIQRNIHHRMSQQSNKPDSNLNPATEKVNNDRLNHVMQPLDSEHNHLFANSHHHNSFGALEADRTGSAQFNASRSRPFNTQGESRGDDKDSAGRLQSVIEFLQKVERASLPPRPAGASVLVEGSLSAIKQHFPLIESAFHKYKMDSTYTAWDDQPPQQPTPTAEDPEMDNWSVLLCLNVSTDASQCVVSARLATKREFQKKNVVPGLVLPPFKACDVHPSNHSKQAPGRWYGQDLSCYPVMVPPYNNYNETVETQADDIMVAIGSCQTSSGWWISGVGHAGDAFSAHLPCGGDASDFNPLRERHPAKETIAISLPSQLFLINGKDPLVIQMQVLVTSVRPLRAYVHPSGLSWEGLTAFIGKKPHRNMSLVDLQQVISEVHGDASALFAISMLEERILNMLTFTDGQIRTDYSTVQRKCHRCFQLLDVAIGFNSSFYPFIIQVSPTTYASGLTSLNNYLLEQSVLEDLAAMLSSKESTATAISVALARFGLTSVINDNVCNDNLSLCLNKHHLTYLLDSRRELGASKDWRRLFPTTSNSYDTPPLPSSSKPSYPLPNPTDHKIHVIPGAGHSPIPSSKGERSEGDHDHLAFTRLVTAIETFFSRPSKLDDSKSFVNNAVNAFRNNKAERKHCANVTSHQTFTQSLHNILSFCSCDNNSNSLSYLSAIHFHPHLQLRPEFSPLTTEYQAHVPYDRLVVSITARARHCQASVLIDKNSVNNRWSNLSLGLGENLIHVIIVDSGSNWGLNAYKVRIHRIRHDHRLGRFDAAAGTHHRACSLLQDCSLPYNAQAKCGLQPSKEFASWQHFLTYRSNLPSCSSHEVDGHWMIPCSSCHNNSSCFWQKAVWQSHGCQEKTLTRDESKQCFQGKRVLFIGDSTNRGILHYLIERMNGSLEQWDKTHNMKVYSALNEGRTTLGFAYYPQFWLSLDQRPVFEEAVRRLIQRASLPGNSTHSVIIALGGVHWLEKHHLDTLTATLQSEGLGGAQVIVKGLGAGFHQPVGTLRHLSLGDHQRLFQKNEAMLSYALSKGFHVFDTFKMTMARYKDFLQGECSCHFQRVIEKRVPFWGNHHHRSHSTWTPHDVRPQFHVEGDIGAAYSEMFINRICVKGNR